GADSVHNYQQILRQLVYFNRKPAYYLNRAFKLSCSELNGRFSSNDYIQTLTVIHPKVDQQKQQSPPTAPQQKSALHPNDHIMIQTAPVAHAQVNEHKVDVKEARIKSASGFLEGGGLIDASDAFGRTTAMNARLSPIVVGHAVTIIIVVCVGFLVFMIVLGVIRIRAAHQRSGDHRDDDQEMAWDDS
ncbi:unnamed protein product, partial [Oppiella nova]